MIAVGLAALLVFVEAGCVHVADPGDQPTLRYSAEPATILREVQSRGARTVVWELYHHRPDWDRMLRSIESGDGDALAVALALRKESDAGASEELTIAVTLALLEAPGPVLRSMIPVFSLVSVCTSGSSEDESYEAAITELDRLRTSVASLTDSDLVERRAACLHALDQSRASLRHFYGRE